LTTASDAAGAAFEFVGALLQAARDVAAMSAAHEAAAAKILRIDMMCTNDSRDTKNMATTCADVDAKSVR
jgi:hypothetical protein